MTIQLWPRTWNGDYWAVRPEAAANAQRVIDMFKSAYGDYKTFAWGHDALAPQFGEFIDGQFR